jgi:putative radical SAM enzyme (TIGR03279 family)
MERLGDYPGVLCEAQRVARQAGGVIAAVEPDSLGQELGLKAGDRLVTINEHTLRDIIDVQFYSAEEELELVVERDGNQWLIVVEREYDEELGLTFANPTFDVQIRRCANRCDFCFVKQNPPGMRKSLYVKDDDYRYSFLFGNFVTLTNLTQEDWARLEEQRLSPLYVSVHATELNLRRRFLGRKDAPDIVEQLWRLAELGIEVHTQVVLVPGVNDGEHLDRTISDLTALYRKPVASIGVVPIGLTKYHLGRCRTYTAEESRAVLDQIEPRRIENRESLGCAFVYPADEWYLVAKQQFPAADRYDGFPQLENGVGMTRQLLDEWADLKADLPRLELKSATLACGTLIAPVLARIVAEWNALAGADLSLMPVVNQFFGPVTTVSGLLTGRDVVDALRGQPLGEKVLLPRAMFTGRYGAGAAPPNVTLDDIKIDDISAQLGVPVEMAGALTEVLDQLA